MNYAVILGQTQLIHSEAERRELEARTTGYLLSAMTGSAIAFIYFRSNTINA
jgi:hypothetical protein